MLQNKLKLCIVLLLVLILTRLEAQEAIPSTGGNASGSGGSVSYSFGQIVYTTNTGINGSVAQGVQQPYEISVVTGVEEANGINLIWTAYPNPATDHLQLKVESNFNFSLSTLTYSLYDISGKLLENKTIERNETTIAMGSLSSSTYFIKVYDNKKTEVKTFKIIKN